MYRKLHFICFSVNACEGLTSADQGLRTQDQRPAYQAIDGNIDQTSNYASAQDPKESGTAWWRVDLGFRRTIVNLTILWANQSMNSILSKFYSLYSPENISHTVKNLIGIPKITS